jgi:hypothetical protein
MDSAICRSGWALLLVPHLSTFFLMKINNIAVTAAALALAIVASANAATPALTVTPFVKGEVQVVKSGLKNSISSSSAAKYSSEVGGGFTAGVLVNQKHEFSVNTGYVSFEGSPVVTPGFTSINSKVEQVPVLFNYNYRMPVDTKGRYTVYAGPTIGLIHQDMSLTTTQLGGAGSSFIGSNTKSDNLLAYGATIGVDAKISSHWTAGASVQVLKVASSGGLDIVGTNTRGIEFGSATRPMIALSVGYSW